ncbi:unnamed protein product [Pleuronectes platessa]|uniref:Uncharacterized protein n=1 Tax=Pleuronectes platessa TaxID=8262 RepID=A0A9N7UQ19_PLEPL|nr:unnamed protein product [Pleuronectes platessa]
MERGGRRGRKAEAAVPLYKGKCAPAPIVSLLTGSHGGAECEGGALSCQGFTSIMGGGREKIETGKQQEVERGEVCHPYCRLSTLTSLPEVPRRHPSLLSPHLILEGPRDVGTGSRAPLPQRYGR